MKLTLQLDLDNEAFHPYARSEVVRILRDMAEEIDTGLGLPPYHAIRDINGNPVGSVEVR